MSEYLQQDLITSYGHLQNLLSSLFPHNNFDEDVYIKEVVTDFLQKPGGIAEAVANCNAHNMSNQQLPEFLQAVLTGQSTIEQLLEKEYAFVKDEATSTNDSYAVAADSARKVTEQKEACDKLLKLLQEEFASNCRHLELYKNQRLMKELSGSDAEGEEVLGKYTILGNDKAQYSNDPNRVATYPILGIKEEITLPKLQEDAIYVTGASKPYHIGLKVNQDGSITAKVMQRTGNQIRDIYQEIALLRAKGCTTIDYNGNPDGWKSSSFNQSDLEQNIINILLAQLNTQYSIFQLAQEPAPDKLGLYDNSYIKVANQLYYVYKDHNNDYQKLKIESPPKLSQNLDDGRRCWLYKKGEAALEAVKSTLSGNADNNTANAIVGFADARQFSAFNDAAVRSILLTHIANNNITVDKDGKFNFIDQRNNICSVELNPVQQEIIEPLLSTIRNCKEPTEQAEQLNDLAQALAALAVDQSQNLKVQNNLVHIVPGVLLDLQAEKPKFRCQSNPPVKFKQQNLLDWQRALKRNASFTTAFSTKFSTLNDAIQRSCKERHDIGETLQSIGRIDAEPKPEILTLEVMKDNKAQLKEKVDSSPLGGKITTVPIDDSKSNDNDQSQFKVGIKNS